MLNSLAAVTDICPCLTASTSSGEPFSATSLSASNQTVAYSEKLGEL